MDIIFGNCSKFQHCKAFIAKNIFEEGNFLEGHSIRETYRAEIPFLRRVF